jgi:hypothetical protein
MHVHPELVGAKRLSAKHLNVMGPRNPSPSSTNLRCTCIKVRQAVTPISSIPPQTGSLIAWSTNPRCTCIEDWSGADPASWESGLSAGAGSAWDEWRGATWVVIGAPGVQRLPPARLSRQPGQLRAGLPDPVVIREGVGAESLERTFLGVVKQGTMEAERGGFGIVNQTGGVTGTHLE